MKTKLETELWTKLEESNTKMTTTLVDNFNDKFKTKYVPNVGSAIDSMNNSVTEFADLFNKGDEGIDAITKQIGEDVRNISNFITGANNTAQAEANKVANAKNNVDTSDASNIAQKMVNIRNAEETVKAIISKARETALKKLEEVEKRDVSELNDKQRELLHGKIVSTEDNPISSKITYEDGSQYQKINVSGNKSITKINDGLVSQNGNIAKIDSEDQILVAKNGGPIDKILNQITPRPLPYDSYVKERPYGINTNTSGQIEVAPIQINLNGNIQLSGLNGTSIDITSQLKNNPEFIRSLAQIISTEVEKKVQGGRVVNPLNRNLLY